MTEKSKIFTKGKIKAGLVTLAAAAVLLGAPHKVAAQDIKKDKVEKFTPNKADAVEKGLYDATVMLLETKYKERAADMATKIMTDAQKFEGAKFGKYVQKAVETAMGPEHAAEMAAARSQRGIAEVVVLDAREVKVPANTPQTVIEPPLAHVVAPQKSLDNTVVEGNTTTTTRKLPNGVETKAVTVDEEGTRTITSRESVFSAINLKPEQRQEYNMILAKVKAADELKGRRSFLSQQIAVIIFETPAEQKDKIFKAHTSNTLFRDIDENSFVAYNTKNGQSKIYAPAEKMKDLEKMVKKTGGAVNFVQEGQQKEVKKSNVKADDMYVDFGR